MNRRLRLLPIPFVALCAVLVGCPSASEEENAETAPVTVELQTVERGEIVRRLGYTGDVEAEVEIRVFSPIMDRILTLGVKEGDEVKAGHVIATIRSSLLQQGVRQASGGVDAAKAQRLALADQLDRLKKLRDSGAVTSSQLLSVEAQLAAADAQIMSMQATLGQAKQRKGDAIVKAPISGLIGQVFLEEGDMAAPQLPICTLVDMDRVRIRVRVSESDLPLLKVGQEVSFHLLADAEHVWRAKVSRISPVLDRMSRTASLEIDVENKEHRLRPGMLARVDIEVERKTGVILVPKAALTVTADRKNGVNLYRAVVAKDGKAIERMVLIGLEEGVYVEVTEGLNEGEKLVVLGQHVLATGDLVKETKRHATGVGAGSEPSEK